MTNLLTRQSILSCFYQWLRPYKGYFSMIYLPISSSGRRNERLCFQTLNALSSLFVFKLLRNCRKGTNCLVCYGTVTSGREGLSCLWTFLHGSVTTVTPSSGGLWWWQGGVEKTTAFHSVQLGCWSGTVKISWLTSLILGNWKIFHIEKYFLSDILRLQDGSSGRDEKESR